MNNQTVKLTRIIANLFFYWVPVILWSYLIFYVSSRPSSDLPHIATVPYVDKVAHIMEYGILAFLLLRAIFYYWPDKQKRYLIFIIVFLSCTAYGLTDEFHQSFVEERFVELGDLIADSLGALGGIILTNILARK